MPRIVDSSGAVGACHALPGAPVICGIAGDQQASLVGQGCTRPGLAKATFGTGGMLDQCTGPEGPPTHAGRGSAGTFPIVAYRIGGRPTWGVEAVMLSAGTCVEWLRDDLGLLTTAEESAAVAARCETTGDVWFVPALLGMGTPVWDFGARGALVGLTRGSGRPELVRAVLEGVAHRGADLVEAAEGDSGYPIGVLRIDGGMSDNEVFVTALADAIGRPVEISPVLEATTLGAGLLAGLAIGTYASPDDLAETFTARRTVEPRLDEATRAHARDRWLAARSKAEATIPELSGLSFLEIPLPFSPMRVGIRVYPASKRTQVGGRYGEGDPPVLVVRVNAPAIDGRANAAVIEALAEAFEVRRADISVLTAPSSRNKVVEVTGGSVRTLISAAGHLDDLVRLDAPVSTLISAAGPQRLDRAAPPSAGIRGSGGHDIAVLRSVEPEQGRRGDRREGPDAGLAPGPVTYPAA